MTAPTPDQDYDTIWEAGRADGYEAGRDEFAHALAAVTSNRDYWLSQSARLSAELIAAEDEATAARQMLADAPHADLCKAANGWPSNECDCWNAGV